jgi:hypothetical protein
VERDHGPLVEGAESFHSTRWTVVMRAAQSQAPWGQSALAELCHLYWYPFYTFARRRGRSPEDAEDAEKRYRLEPVDFLAAGKIFDALCEALIATDGRLDP